MEALRSVGTLTVMEPFEVVARRPAAESRAVTAAPRFSDLRLDSRVVAGLKHAALDLARECFGIREAQLPNVLVQREVRH